MSTRKGKFRFHHCYAGAGHVDEAVRDTFNDVLPIVLRSAGLETPKFDVFQRAHKSTNKTMTAFTSVLLSFVLWISTDLATLFLHLTPSRFQQISRFEISYQGA